MTIFCYLLEGTTKRKELHGTTGVRALYGTWALEKNVVKLQGYRLKFSCNQVGQRYSDFVLLVDATLEIEGDNLDIDLYLHDKMVKASVAPCGLLELGVQQVCSSLCLLLATFIAPSLLLFIMKYFFCFFSRLDGASKAISSAYVQQFVREVVYWIKIVKHSEGVYFQ
jgi:hypothetical protein